MADGEGEAGPAGRLGVVGFGLWLLIELDDQCSGDLILQILGKMLNAVHCLLK